MSTRFRRQLTSLGIPVNQLSGKVINPTTGRPYSRNHLYSVARGETSPTQTFIAAAVAAVRKMSRRKISASDLFDFDLQRRKAS